MTKSPSDTRQVGPYSGLTVNSAKRFLMAHFREAGLETPDLDARLILMEATGFSHAELIMRGTENLSPESHSKLSDYAERRLAGEPIDHIFGYAEFYGRRFVIGKEVLSPRPETEMLVDAALNILKDKAKACILDLGTGSGAIIISILAEAESVRGFAVDLSIEALGLAQKNAATHKIGSRLTFLEGSWFAPVTGQFDIILSNPPYITSEAMTELDIEVKNFDPDLALRGGDDGLDAYRTIINEAKAFLKPNGVLLFEIGYDQGEAVSFLLRDAGFTGITVEKDLSGQDRMIKAAL
jgi:release factor glutamine methyltransferase